MKPFDLEAAKRGEPICDRAGNPVRFIAHVPEATNPGKRVIVLTLDEAISLHYENGAYALSDCDYDLFMATKKVKREGWINVYSRHSSDTMHTSKEKADIGASSDAMHTSKEKADIGASRGRIACVYIEYEFEE